MKVSSYREFKNFIKADLRAHGIDSKSSWINVYIKTFFNKNYVVRFQIILRLCELLSFYYSRNKLFGLVFFPLYFYFKGLSKDLGFTIPLHVFGYGLAIVHVGTIVINHKVNVGNNCRIHVCVNIGATGGSSKAPRLGDNVYIGPGVKIFGDIKICDNVILGANTVVNKDLVRPNMVYAGVPAKGIKETIIGNHFKNSV